MMTKIKLYLLYTRPTCHPHHLIVMIYDYLSLNTIYLSLCHGVIRKHSESCNLHIFTMKSLYTMLSYHNHHFASLSIDEYGPLNFAEPFEA